MRRLLYSCTLVLIATSLAIGASPPAATTIVSPEAQKWIDQLAAEDPAARKEAQEQLLGLGLSARPALLEAQREGNPEVRLRIAEILQKLPWTDPGDAPAVRQILQNYGESETATRRMIIRSLGEL